MERIVIILVANSACIAACGALLLFFPMTAGFTVTTPKSTHFLPGGEFLSTVLLCLVDLTIAVYLAWSFVHYVRTH